MSITTSPASRRSDAKSPDATPGLPAPAILAQARPLIVAAHRTEIFDEPAPYRRVFDERRAIVCHDLLDAALLETLIERCRSGQFVAEYVESLGPREVEAPQRVGRALNFLFSRPSFLRWVESATGRGPLGAVAGHVVQMRGNGDDQLDWHNDYEVETRRLGFTLSLSDADYVGGDFELRSVGVEEPMLRFRHDRAGVGLIFDIGLSLEHRVLPVISGGPRRIYAGWFMRGSV